VDGSVDQALEAKYHHCIGWYLSRLHSDCGQVGGARGLDLVLELFFFRELKILSLFFPSVDFCNLDMRRYVGEWTLSNNSKKTLNNFSQLL